MSGKRVNETILPADINGLAVRSLHVSVCQDEPSGGYRSIFIQYFDLKVCGLDCICGDASSFGVSRVLFSIPDATIRVDQDDIIGVHTSHCCPVSFFHDAGPIVFNTQDLRFDRGGIDRFTGGSRI